jgi:hypothetical protein
MLYYASEIRRFKKTGLSDQQIIDYFNITFINESYLKYIENFDKLYHKKYRRTYVRPVTSKGPREESNNAKVLKLIEPYGMDNFKKLIKEKGAAEVARIIGQPIQKLINCMKYWGVQQYRIKPKYLGKAKTIIQKKKTKHLEKPGMNNLLKLF